MTEYFYVVDEKDRVIGKATREECHSSNRLIHRSVYVFLLDSEGRLFLQKRSSKKDLYPGYYTGSATGHVDYGETYEEAARRELKEELGIEEVQLKMLCKFRCFSEIEREISALYICRYDGPVRFDREEIEEGAFLSVEEVERAIRSGEKRFAKGFKLAFREFLRHHSA
ncbi:MAG: NUDIX hydrolase [Candidatus Bathyarchaeota archaeon B26-2]|nr:MAG: NUDIX hydrolase [Candidatus Bathyarchaeota archaeon B26-2]